MLFGVSARKMFAAFAIGADAAAVPPSFLFRLPFFSERKAGKRKPIAGRIFLSTSALPTCCTKRTVHIRTARFFCGADCDGGKKAFSSPFPRPRSVSCCFSAEKVPLPLLKKAKRGALSFGLFFRTKTRFMRPALDHRDRREICPVPVGSKARPRRARIRRHSTPE